MIHVRYLLAVLCILLFFSQVNCQRQRPDEIRELPETESLPDQSKTEDNQTGTPKESKPEEKETTDNPNFNGKYITALLPEGFTIVEKQDGAGTPGQNIGYLVGGVEYKGLTQITILDPTGLDIVKIMAAHNTIDPASVIIPAGYDFVKELSFTADGVRQNTYVVMEWFDGVSPEIRNQLNAILASIKVK